MLLNAWNLSKSYGAINVLEDISFSVDLHDRVGIVCANGVGKSTLLRILVDQEQTDTGSFQYATSVEVGYLPQTTPEFYGRTIQDLIWESVGNLRQLEERMRQLEAQMAKAGDEQLAALLEAYGSASARFQDRGGYDLDYRIEQIFDGLRLSYLPRERDVGTLSGGEKARVGLATLLLRAPDILLLDEPTNHLDFAALAWLEDYLSHSHAGMLIVSHDRQFLNRAVNRIFEIDEYDHHLKKYEGNYDAYVQAKAAKRKKLEEDYERQQEEIKELRKRIKESARQVGHPYRAPRDNDKSPKYFFAQRVDVAVSRNVRAAEEQLKRIEADPIPKPPELMRVNSQFNSEPMQSQVVMSVDRLMKCWGAHCVLDNVSFTIAPDARIVLVGPNGVGKTTLLKLLAGLETPDQGTVQVVGSARVGYLPQQADDLDPACTVLETYRYGQVGYEAAFVAKLIGYGLFRLEDMHKRVAQLSVGQQRKLEIARLMARQPNVLLLDEPTNYISLDVLEAFEAAILNFPGPVIAVSHDRWFIQRIDGQVWEMNDGRLTRPS